MFFKKQTGKTTVDVVESCIPNIYINNTALLKMQIYIETCSTEVGWLGTAFKEDNDIVIEDVIMFEQNVHSATTEITPEGLAKFAERILQQENGMELWNNIKVWGHSHVNMGVFASVQDNTQMEAFVESGHDWFIRIIANKKGDIKVDYYDYVNGIAFSNLEFYILMSKEEKDLHDKITNLNKKLQSLQEIQKQDFKKIIEAEIKEKVSEIKYHVVQKGARGVIINNVDDGYYNALVYDSYPGEIKTDEDVWKLFDRAELLDIGEAGGYIDAIKIIKSFNNSYYSEKELRKIWDVAQDVVKRVYEITLKEDAK